MKNAVIFFLFLSIALSGFAAAKYITISTAAEESFTETGRGIMNITIANYGDEPANNVRISVISDDVSSDEIAQKALNPNERLRGIINIETKKEIIPGKYPVFVMTEYEDANSYPFTAISPAFFVYKTQTSSRVKGTVSSVDIVEGATGTLGVRLVNYGDEPANVSIRLVLSRELSAEQDKKMVALGGNGADVVYFSVTSFSALAGSTYPAFVGIEYESGGAHYASFASGQIKIFKSEGILSNQTIIIMLGLLIVILLYGLFKGRLHA